MARSPGSTELAAALAIAGLSAPACGQRLEPTQQGKAASMDEVSAAADRAAEALAAGRFQEASDLYDQVIAGIGDSYRHEGTLDDTPTKLAMARAQAAKGEWRSAANLKKSVAESRLALAHGR